ncbi:hypothetical protein [Streptococcus gallolyticus]|nr:hypothetical protein [Streptococcus gallolyticus]
MKKHLVVEIENAEEFEKLYNDYLKKASGQGLKEKGNGYGYE